MSSEPRNDDSDPFGLGHDRPRPNPDEVGDEQTGTPFGVTAGDRPVATPDEERVVLQPEVSVTAAEARELDRRAGWAAANWGWLAAFGGVGIIFGIVVLSRAFGSLTALVWLTGLFLVFAGLVQLVTRGRDARSAHFGAAAIAVIGGLVLLIWPGETLKVVAVIGGITVLLWGVVRGVGAFRGPREARGHDLIVGIALGVLGILMIAWPGATVTLIGVLVGLAALAWGTVTIVVALRLRKEGARWRTLHARSHSAS